MRTATAAALLLLAAASASAADPPAPTRRQTIESIVRLSRAEELEKTAIATVIDALMSTAATNDQKEALRQLRVRAMSQTTEESWISAYDRAFDDKSLAALLAFYETPAAGREADVADRALRDALQQRMKPAEVNAAERDVRAARATIADLRTLATALEARATDTNEYPEAADMEALRALLEPTYVRHMPARDAWGHEYIYLGSPDKQQYRFVSAGSDGVFEPASRQLTKMPARESDRLEEDIIFQDGEFVQVPRGILPRE
jgi:ribonucleotide reductase alpha subunit